VSENPLRDWLVAARRVRAALRPRPVPVLTDQERADDLLYHERRCFACLEEVVNERGVTWRLTRTHAFLFHAECGRRIQLAHPGVTLRELLATVRAGREAK
jgi:hypothetical protein